MEKQSGDGERGENLIELTYGDEINEIKAVRTMSVLVEV